MLLTAVLLSFYAFLLVLYLALDWSVALSLTPWFGLVFGLLGIIPGAVGLAAQRSPAVALACGLFIAVVLAAPWIDLGPRKPFLRAAAGIQSRMSLAEVDRRMAAFERSPQAAGTLGDGDSVVYHNRFGAGDVDSVQVTFESGAVRESRVLLD
jgi:hypothetical protein